MGAANWYVGLDEAGRGALAGPVFVGAVSLPRDSEEIVARIAASAGLPRLKDSKKLSAAARERVCEALRSEGVSYAWGRALVSEINDVGIVPAITLAAGRALRIICPERPDPKGVLVRADAGLFHPFEEALPTRRFVKGDELYPEISLASIVAKVMRDRHMQELALAYPEYGFERHSGYGTVAHVEAIRRAGPSPEHRILFIRNILNQTIPARVSADGVALDTMEKDML